MIRVLSKRGINSAASNLLLGVIYLYFVVIHVTAFVQAPRLSVLALALFETVCVVMILIRTDSREVWHSWKTWVTTMGGTFLPLLLRPTGALEDHLTGQVIQLVGLGLQIWAILALNRSFGLLPARRHVKTGGPYRGVRHPLYAAYALAQTGYVISNPSLLNLAILVTATALQVMRIRNEEAFLGRDEGYAAYARRTRWRLIPLVW